MFTLNEASKDTKKLLKLGALFLAFIVFSFILIKIAIIVKGMLFPAPPPKAASLFGQLPKQVFPQNSQNQNFSYSVNTLTGFLPGMPTVANVYRMQITRPTLLGVSKFQDKIAVMGFPRNYVAISDVIFEWQLNSAGLIKTLRGNTITGNFSITSPYLSDPNILIGKNTPNQTMALKIVSDMFSRMNLITPDLDLTKTRVNLFSLKNGVFSPATSISTAQAIEVNYYQKDIDKLPIYYEKPNSSNINALVAGGNAPQIVSASYFLQIPSSEVSTYTLKSAPQALEDLKQGNGYIASYDGTSSNISINNVILAYYIGSQAQDFLMPIFVFTGNDNFYAYVWAVTDELISK